MPALGTTTANFTEDVDSPSSGLTFNFQSGTLSNSMLDSFDRFTLGICPPPGGIPAICLVGYGFFGPITGSTGEILIDETNTGMNLQPNPFPVIVFMNEPLP